MKGIIFLILMTLFCQAGFANQDAIDLGNLEVEGETRRPLMDFVPTDHTIVRELKSVAFAQIDRLLILENSKIHQEKQIKTREQTQALKDLQGIESQILGVK